MKDFYEKPELEITEYKFEDIIAASGWSVVGEDGKSESGAPDIFTLRH